MSLQEIIEGERFRTLALGRRDGECIVIADSRGPLAIVKLHYRPDGKFSLVTYAPPYVRVDRGEVWESKEKR